MPSGRRRIGEIVAAILQEALADGEPPLRAAARRVERTLACGRDG